MAMTRSGGRTGSRISFGESGMRRGGGFGTRLFHIVLGLVLLWTIGLLGFIAAIPQPAANQPASSQPTPDQPTDVIIVLTGGGDRLAEGFRLLDRGLAKKLLISGVAPGVTLPQLLSRLGDPDAPKADALACCVTLGYEAASTAGNASEGAQWLRENGAASVRLVTANYHMPRSLLEFRRTVPDVTVIANPVFPSEVRDPHWYIRPRTLLLIVNEYHKYLLALARGLPGEIHNWPSHWPSHISFSWSALKSLWPFS